MTRSTAFGLVLAAAGALGMAAGCGGASTSNSVVAPTGTLLTDTLSGTVQPGGVDFQPFTVTTGGTVNVTLLTAGPPPTITTGLALGTPSGTGCGNVGPWYTYWPYKNHFITPAHPEFPYWPQAMGPVI